MKKSKALVCICFVVVTLEQLAGAQQANIRKIGAPRVTSSEREQDGLNGRVRRVRVETAKVIIKDGKLLEGSRVLGGITTYDINGRKVDSVAYPVESSAPSGREQYRYDDNGNITEMIVRGADGSILTKEIYQYDFDAVGNWKKMNTSVAVFEDGKLSFEPVEVTYRTITYYYDQAIDRIAAAAPAKSVSIPGSSESPDAVRKSKTAPPAEEGMVKSEPRIISSDVTSEKGPVTTPVTKGSVETLQNATVNLPQLESPTSDLSSQPSKGAPAAVPLTSSVEEKQKAATPTGPTSPPPNNAASSGATTAALKVAPTVAPSEEATQFYQHGLTHLMAGRYSEAVAEFRQAVDHNPDDALAYAKLGLAYAALGQHKEAVATLKVAIRINAQVVDVEGYYRLGDSYTSLGKRSEALQALKKAMYILRAQALESNSSKYTGVPTLPQLHYALGLANYNSENYKDAMKEFKQAIELKPDFAEAHYGVALTHLAFDDLKSAQKEEERLRPLNTNLADKVAAALNTSSNSLPGTEGVGRRRP
jgi:YD repeat-containing protein